MIQKSYEKDGVLYLIPTPIGNLDDITVRALKLLQEVEVLLCEDTRVTGQLLSYYKIKKKLISCHEYNESKLGMLVLSFLKKGKNVGLVTDQGTPIISDPGFLISKQIIDSGYSVVGLPGATAFVPALISSGISPSPFLFYGFLNSKSVKRRKELESLKKYPYTIIFYEAPHRICDTMNDLLEIFGDRDVALNKEISKRYETIVRGKISNVLNDFDAIRGEFVIVVDGNREIEDFSSLNILEHVNLYIDDGLREMDAIKKVSKERGVSKSVIYKEYVNRRESRNSEFDSQ